MLTALFGVLGGLSLLLLLILLDVLLVVCYVLVVVFWMVYLNHLYAVMGCYTLWIAQ